MWWGLQRVWCWHGIGCGDVSGCSDAAIGNIPRVLQATFPLSAMTWPEPRLTAWDSGDPQHTAAHQVTPWGAPQPPFPTHSTVQSQWECTSSASTASIPMIPAHPPTNRASLTLRGPCVRPWFASPHLSILLGTSRPYPEGTGVGTGTQPHSEALAGGGSSSFHPNCISPSTSHSPLPSLTPLPCLGPWKVTATE